MKSTVFKKQIKRRITGREHSFFVICPPGLTSFCKNEILNSGFNPDKLTLIQGGIEVTCKPDICMLLNLKLGSPSRILMRISRFKAVTFSQFEKKITSIEWKLFLPENCIPKFKVHTRKSRLYHSDAIAQRCEAIFRQQRTTATVETSQQPDKKASQTIYIRADHDTFMISLDCSGPLLYKRGIKKKVSPAPLRETLAFAMLHWTGFSSTDILVDPMCGSGTFSLEGAMIKSQTPPGFFRSFAFESWPGFSQKTFAWQKKQISDLIQEQCKKLNGYHIFSSDIDDMAIAAVKQNCLNLPFSALINTDKKDFFTLLPDKAFKGRKGVVMLNPPYGKRLGKQKNTVSFYREITRKLALDFKGWRVGIIFPDRKTLSSTGLQLRPYPLFHGGLDIFAGVGVI